MANAMDFALDNASKALDTSGIGKSTVEGLQLGMSLAQRQQDFEKQQQEIEFKQKQHTMQTHDFLHDSLKTALSEDDPKMRSVLLDNLDQSFPKLFDGKRIDPATMELMKKSSSFMEKILAASRVRTAMRTGNFEHLEDFDNEVINSMTSSDIAGKLGHLNTIQTQENAIVKGLTQKGIATPTAAKEAGMSQEELQDKLSQGNLAEVRRARLAMQVDDQASKAGHSFDSDKKLTNLYQVNQKANRDMYLLNDSSRPFTSQNASEIEATIPMLLGGAGSGALGATERIEMETAQRKLSQLIQKWSGKPDDLRQRDPELVSYLQHTVGRLLESTQQAQEEVAVGISKNFEQSGNPKVHAVNQAKLHQYAPKYYDRTYGMTGSQMSTGKAPSEPPLEPKKSQVDMELIDKQAKEKLRQIREAQKTGFPISTTEDQVKQTYRNLTGKDLVE